MNQIQTFFLLRRIFSLLTLIGTRNTHPHIYKSKTSHLPRSRRLHLLRINAHTTQLYQQHTRHQQRQFCTAHLPNHMDIGQARRRRRFSMDHPVSSINRSRHRYNRIKTFKTHFFQIRLHQTSQHSRHHTPHPLTVTRRHHSRGTLTHPPPWRHRHQDNVSMLQLTQTCF